MRGKSGADGLSELARSSSRWKSASLATKPLGGWRVSQEETIGVGEFPLPHGVGDENDADLSVTRRPWFLELGLSNFHHSLFQPGVKGRLACAWPCD